MDATFNRKANRHKSSAYPSSGAKEGERTRDIIEVRATLREQRLSNQMLRKSVAESVIDEDAEFDIYHRT